jgi:phytoene dehydrogenase-like protein
MKRHDGILIGGGHNGLVAAGYLQRAGRDVLVVEQNPWVGGAATSRDTGTGVTFSNCSDVCSLGARSHGFRRAMARPMKAMPAT